MKTLTARVPDALVAQIEAESRSRHLSKSDAVRERLSTPARGRSRRVKALNSIAGLVGSVDALPADLSTEKKRRLRSQGHGVKRSR